MASFVVNSITISDEFFGANSACIWFFPSVSSNMIHPTCLVFKDLSTVLIRALMNFSASSITNLSTLHLTMDRISSQSHWWHMSHNLLVNFTIYLVLQVHL